MQVINNVSSVTVSTAEQPTTFFSNNVQTLINSPINPSPCPPTICFFFDFDENCFFRVCNQNDFCNCCPNNGGQPCDIMLGNWDNNNNCNNCNGFGNNMNNWNNQCHKSNCPCRNWCNCQWNNCERRCHDCRNCPICAALLLCCLC